MKRFKIKYLKLCQIETEYHINTPESMIKYVKNDIDWVSESMWIIGMDIKNQVIYKKEIVKGGYNIIIATPAEIFVPLLKCNARNFIIIHTHLSDGVEPSEEDIIFTKKITKGCEYVGLNMLDHIIVTEKDSYSFKKNNLI